MSFEMDLLIREERSKAEGKIETLFGLVLDGTLPIETAAEHSPLTLGDFKTELTKFQQEQVANINA